MCVYIDGGHIRVMQPHLHKSCPAPGANSSEHLEHGSLYIRLLRAFAFGITISLKYIQNIEHFHSTQENTENQTSVKPILCSQTM